MFLRDRLKYSKPIYPDKSVIKQFKCDFCSYSNQFKCKFLKHTFAHSKEKLFKRLHGLQTFSQNPCLKSDIRIKKTKKKLYECAKCDKKFKYLSWLKNHVLSIHDKSKPFVCEVCGFQSFRKANLERHKLIHSDVRDFQCRYCNKKFITATNLKSHERVHTGEKPFKCKECSYASNQATHLHNHVIFRHSKKFPYKCCICEKGFVSPGLLQKHESRCKKRVKS